MNNQAIAVSLSMSCYDLLSTTNYDVVYFTSKLPSKSLNEDGLLIYSVPHGIVMAVADGVGGSVDSFRAVDFALYGILDVFKQDNLTYSMSEIVYAIEMKLHQVNNKILNLSGPPQTTLAIIVIINKKITIFQIGDSGILLAGCKGKLKFLTPFQSEVGELLSKKLITPENALLHPRLNIVNNVMGCRDFYITKFQSDEVCKHNNSSKISKFDTIFLATDGIFDNYTGTELASIIGSEKLEDLAKKIVYSIQNNINILNNKPLFKSDDASFIICRRK